MPKNLKNLRFSCIFPISSTFIQGRRLHPHHNRDDDDDVDSNEESSSSSFLNSQKTLKISSSKKSIPVPTIIFGNPSVVGSKDRDESYQGLVGSDKIPISLEIYEQEMNKLTTLTEDEAIVRNILIKRWVGYVCKSYERQI